MMDDAFGDRMKRYEAVETSRRLIPMLPTLARVDGRCFSRFTAEMRRPFDEDMHECMVATAQSLMEETHAIAAYTQSDEISLLLYSEDPKSEMLFGGKVEKLTSVTASIATAAFTRHALPVFPGQFSRALVTFDCRVWQVPTDWEAANAFLWREQDATKNAVSMAARSMFPHSRLQGKTSAQMQEMMFQEHGVNFNDYPAEFKRGTFLRRRKEWRKLGPEELARVPEPHREAASRASFHRPVILAGPLPVFSRVSNRVDVLFKGSNPITHMEAAVQAA